MPEYEDAREQIKQVLKGSSDRMKVAAANQGEIASFTTQLPAQFGAAVPAVERVLETFQSRLAQVAGSVQQGAAATEGALTRAAGKFIGIPTSEAGNAVKSGVESLQPGAQAQGRFAEEFGKTEVIYAALDGLRAAIEAKSQAADTAGLAAADLAADMTRGAEETARRAEDLQ